MSRPRSTSLRKPHRSARGDLKIDGFVLAKSIGFVRLRYPVNIEIDAQYPFLIVAAGQHEGLRGIEKSTAQIIGGTKSVRLRAQFDTTILPIIHLQHTVNQM